LVANSFLTFKYYWPPNRASLNFELCFVIKKHFDCYCWYSGIIFSVDFHLFLHYYILGTTNFNLKMSTNPFAKKRQKASGAAGRRQKKARSEENKELSASLMKHLQPIPSTSRQETDGKRIFQLLVLCFPSLGLFVFICFNK
jgi:hypothetical protein